MSSFSTTVSVLKENPGELRDCRVPGRGREPGRQVTERDALLSSSPPRHARALPCHSWTDRLHRKRDCLRSCSVQTWPGCKGEVKGEDGALAVRLPVEALHSSENQARIQTERREPGRFLQQGATHSTAGPVAARSQPRGGVLWREQAETPEPWARRGSVITQGEALRRRVGTKGSRSCSLLPCTSRLDEGALTSVASSLAPVHVHTPAGHMQPSPTPDSCHRGTSWAPSPGGNGSAQETHQIQPGLRPWLNQSHLRSINLGFLATYCSTRSFSSVLRMSVKYSSFPCSETVSREAT